MRQCVDDRGVESEQITLVLEDGSMGIEEVVGIDLDDLKFYPNVRCSEWRTEGK